MMLSTISIYNSDVMIVIMTYTIYNIIILYSIYKHVIYEYHCTVIMITT